MATITWTASRTKYIHTTLDTTTDEVRAIADRMNIGSVLFLEVDKLAPESKCCVCSCYVDEDNDCDRCGSFYCDDCGPMHVAQRTACELFAAPVCC